MGKVRRLAVYLERSADKLVPSRDESNVHIRSLSYFTPDFWTPRKIKLLRPIFKDFKLLRVLKLENMRRLVKLSRDIGSLIHLRFLSLRRSNITRFPSSVGNLLRLQTLDLRFYNDSAVIPNVIWKMDQLRHLYLPFPYSISGNDKLRLAPLRNLQTLQNLSTHDSDLNEIADLISLRTLGIVVCEGDLRNLEKIFKSTSLKFNRLQSFTVRKLFGKFPKVISMIASSCRQIYKLDLQGPTTELPNDLQYYPNLIKLSLFATDLKEDQITILERLQNLRVLRLFDAFKINTKTLRCSAGGFPRLEFLSLRWMHEIEKWMVDEGAMPCLRRLYIAHCGCLKTVPDGLRYITTLRELAITGMSKAFYSRLEKGGADFDKIQHVPSLDFGPASEELLSSLNKQSR